MRELMGEAPTTLGRITALLHELEVMYAPLPDGPTGVGVAVSYGELGFLVVSVGEPPNDLNVSLTVGIAKDVDEDRLAVLDLCNRHTRAWSAFPVYLHDAPSSWDVILEVNHPVQLFVDIPPFFMSMVRGVLKVGQQVRQTFVDAGFGGQPYEWNPDDTQRLLLRSTM